MTTKLSIIFAVLLWYVTVRHIVMYGMQWVDLADGPNPSNFERVWSWFMAIPITALTTGAVAMIYFVLIPWVIN